MNDIYSRLISAHDVPHIQVTVDPDDEDMRCISFGNQCNPYDGFFEDDVTRLFCDPVRLALALRICNFFDDVDPFHGVPGDEAVMGTFDILGEDPSDIAKQIQDAIDEMNEEPFIFCDTINEGEALLRILQAE